MHCSKTFFRCARPRISGSPASWQADINGDTLIFLDRNISEAEYRRMDATLFNTLGEPRRLQILRCLSAGDHTVGELVTALGASQSSVSKHLKVLKDSGFVQVRVDAQRRIYQLREEPFQAMDNWLNGYRKLWNQSLDALESFLDEETENEEV